MDPKIIASSERILTVLVIYVILKYGPKVGLDQSIAPDLVVLILGGLSAAFGAWKNRKSAIIATASALPEVKSIQLESTPAGHALSEVTPNNVTVGASHV